MAEMPLESAMRPRNGEFGIYPRKVGNGKEIYYYWTYDSEGKRKYRSTGKLTYEDAVKVCRNLLNSNVKCNTD